jgi:outer membrane protein OmpA-like peptidoglycan-associated protein/tetratricopeptide (TPR) repeat protein
MNKLVTYSILLIASFSATAQSTNISTLLFKNEKKADKLFDQMAYQNALHLYSHIIEKDPTNRHARQRLAECYMKLTDPVNAELWLATFVNEPDVKPAMLYLYSEALAMNRNYREARSWMEAYQKVKPEDARAREKLAFYAHVNDFLNDTIRFAVFNTSFNSDQSDFGAHYYKDGLVFASSRSDNSYIKRHPADAHNEIETLLNLYFVEQKNSGDFAQVVLYQSGELESNYHDGPISFYKNRSKAAFTKSNVRGNRASKDEHGKVNLQIFFADLPETGRLQNIKPFEYNNDEYSTAHPSLSHNGEIMFFSSTMPVGLGGSDIYYSIQQNGTWQKPVNVGPMVNTPGDELFPFLANDSTLYFSSNGHGSLGGLDVVVSYIRKNNTFSKTYNFNAPLNSSYDDFSIVTDSTGRGGYFASNRPGGKGLDDIYSFVANYYSLNGQVRELSSEQARLPGTKISVYNKNGDLINSVTTDDEGNFNLTLPFDHDYKIRGEKDGYETLEDLEYSTYGKSIIMDSILLPLWKYKLFAKGRIFSNETQALLTGTTVTLKNLTDNKMDSMIVDEKGEYNFLVRPNKQYELIASKPGFISTGFKLDSKNLYEGDLLNDVVLEEVYIEKEVVLFDYNKSTVSEQSMAQMKRVVRTLKRDPSATLNIGAHADSRGSNETNKRISERRAAAAVDYFVKQGISRKRIEAVGFGEELILNRCSDGVICPEEEHSMNRRAEIKVQGITIRQ